MFRKKKPSEGDIPPVDVKAVPSTASLEELEKLRLCELRASVAEEPQLLSMTTTYVCTVTAQYSSADEAGVHDAPPISRSMGDVNWLRKALTARFPGAVVPPLGETTGFGNEYISAESRLVELTETMEQFLGLVLKVKGGV